MPLNLYTSNRMEVLVDTLKAALHEPLASAFTQEVIVVQSRGMQRWLSMERCSCPVVGIPYRCYRVICEILDEKVSVLVVRVGHRKEVYR